jgi:hypothetical protein
MYSENKTKYHTVGKVKSRNKRGEIIKKLLLKINKMDVNRKLKRGGGKTELNSNDVLFNLCHLKYVLKLFYL